VRLKYVEGHHGYYLDGKRCKGVSTVAKIPEDTWSLDQWRKRMVAIGVASDPRIAAAIAEAGQDKDKLNELAEQALTLAGANVAAERGTQVHATTEAHDLGQEVDDAFDAQRWASVLDGAGFDVVPDLIERVVVFPEHRICGRFDRLATRRHDGALAALDLKTGPSAIRYPHSTVIQLAMYANAPLMADVMDEIEPGVFVTEKFHPLPWTIDRNTGYVIYLPDGADSGVHPVNLKLGWQAVQEVVLPTLAWRKTPTEKLIRRL
jgi:hypothetical protein